MTGVQTCALPISFNMSFLTAKNKVVSKGGLQRTIPVLELTALSFGMECTYQMKESLTQAFCPVSIRGCHIYTDSMVALAWLSSKVTRIKKIEQKGPLINNRLDTIIRLGERMPCTFHHIQGVQNPADCVTRTNSYKVLRKSCYYTGPDLRNLRNEVMVEVSPHSYDRHLQYCANLVEVCPLEPIFNLSRFSSLNKLYKTA